MFLLAYIVLPACFTGMSEIIVFKISEFVTVPFGWFLGVGIGSLILSLIIIIVLRFCILYRKGDKIIQNYFMTLMFVLTISLIIFVAIHNVQRNTLDDMKFAVEMNWSITGVTVAIFAIFASKPDKIENYVKIFLKKDETKLDEQEKEIYEDKKQGITSIFISSIKGFTILLVVSSLLTIISTLFFFAYDTTELVKENLVFLALILSAVVFIYIFFAIIFCFMSKLKLAKKN